MYLSAKEIPKNNLLTNWKGKEGKFVRTFGMNSKRNKNEWRATWDSIKKYIHTAIGLPGIEYEVCREDGCSLDHVDAATFEDVIEKQKPYERTEIIDYVLDDKKESVDLIHEVNDDEFWKKLENREIKYVSPLIFPLLDGIQVLGKGRNDLEIIDTDAWKFAHDAFLTKDPAFGDDIATVKTMCEGENCDVKLLSAQTIPITTLLEKKEYLPGKEESPICGNCKFFVKDEKCVLVQGEIKYEDLCDLHIFGDPKPAGTKVFPDFDKERVNYRNASLEAKEFEQLKCTQKYVTVFDGTKRVGWDSDLHSILHAEDRTHSHVCITPDGKKHIRRWKREPMHSSLDLKGGEFENISCKEKYATIKDGKVKVDWNGKQHQLLHVRNLPHSHVCIKSSGEKTIRRWPDTSALEADTTIANQENISHLQEIPLLYKHKGQLILMATSSCVQEILRKKKEAGIPIDDQALAIAYSECGESSSLKSSFKTCTCTARQNKMAEHDLKKENEDLKAKLKAIEDEDKEEKSHEARRGRYAKLFAQVEDDDREKMIARMKAKDDNYDEDELRAATEIHEEMKSKKGKEDDPEKEEMKARLQALEKEDKEEKMKAMVALQAKYGLPAKQQNEYHASLKGKSYSEVMSKFADVESIINSMKASTTSNSENNFKWNGGDMASLKGKTFEEIAESSQ